MLVNLKITTIGKVISTTLFICLVLIAVKTVNFSDVFAAGGPNATVTFVPDGPSGSNVFKVMLDPDGNDVNGVTIKFDAIGADSSAWNYFDCETQVNCTFPQGAVLTDAIMGNKTVTLINLGSKVNVATHLFTLSLSKNDTAIHTVSTVAGGETIISLTDGTTKAITTAVNYTISANTGNNLPNNIVTQPVDVAQNVSYNQQISASVQDGNDNLFSWNVMLFECPSLTSNPTQCVSNVTGTYYNLPNGATTFSGFTASSNISLSLISQTYLKYNKKYKLNVVAKDDQNGSTSKEITFSTQADQTPPPKQLEAKIDKYGFGTGVNSIVANYSFKVNPDIAPGKLSKAYVFAMQDVNVITPNVMTNGITGLSYSTYSAYSGALNGLIANSGASNTFQSFLSMVDIPTGATSVSGNIAAIRFHRIASSNSQIIYHFKTKLIFLVVADENGNYSDPVHLIKIGDVRGIDDSSYINGGYPDGQISTKDGIYLYRNANDPSKCPLPPSVNTNLADC